jgi:hypothetical protein
MPDADPTVATDGVLLVHMPPPASVSVTVVPTQRVLGPDMADGADITFIVDVVTQPAGVVYVITLLPGPIAVTRPDPDPMVATAVLLLVHVPPLVALVSVVVDPEHSEVSPPIANSGLTVTVCVTRHPVPVSV